MNIKLIIAGAILMAGAYFLDNADLFPKTINFVILAGLLLFFGSKPMAKFLGDSVTKRAQDFLGAKEKAEKAAIELESTIKEFKNMETELSEYKNAIMQRAESEKDEIIQEGLRLSKSIEKQAQEKIDSMKEKAKAELREYLVDEAIKEAIEEIKSGKQSSMLTEESIKLILAKV